MQPVETADKSGQLVLTVFGAVVDLQALLDCKPGSVSC